MVCPLGPARDNAFLVAIVVSLAPFTSAYAQDLSLDQLLSREQQARLGVSTMKPEQRELLLQALIRLMVRGYQAGVKDGATLGNRTQGGIGGQAIEILD